jgi:8-oxo-dGTP pyrophosphatase MutT (NUDIX family)
VEDISVGRDSKIIEAVKELNYQPVEITDEFGQPTFVDQITADYMVFDSVDGGMARTGELANSSHADLWGGEAPDNVSYGVVILDDNENVVMRMPSDLPATGEPFGGVKWTFPKGKPDNLRSGLKESPFETAARETLEETGLEVQIMSPLPGEFQGSTGSTFYFVGRIKAGTPDPSAVMRGTAPTPSAVGAMTPTPGSLAAAGQLSDITMDLTHTTSQGAPNVWQEYGKMIEENWGDKWGYNMSPGNVAYAGGPNSGSPIYKLTAQMPQGAQNIKVYGLPPREAQLAAQLTLQMGIETDPAKLTSLAQRLKIIVDSGKKQVGNKSKVADGLAPQLVDQVARVMDADPELVTELIQQLVSANPQKLQELGKVSEAIKLTRDIGNLRLVPDETLAPEVAEVVNRLASMNTDERLEFAINWVDKNVEWQEPGKSALGSLLTEDGATKAAAYLKGLDSETSQLYLTNRATAQQKIRDWAVELDEVIAQSFDATGLGRARPVEFQPIGPTDASQRPSRLHSQFIDTYKRSLSNDGYNMAVWFNHTDPFPPTAGGPPLGSYTTALGPSPNIVAVNPMSFGYEGIAGKVDVDLGVIPLKPGEVVADDFVGASQYIEDFERMMDAQMVPRPARINLDEDALEALVTQQSEVLATVEGVKAEYTNSVAQLKSAERRLEEAVVGASDKQAHAVAQRQIVSELADQENTVNRALETLDRLGIGEGVDINDIADDDLIALRQATEILIQGDADMNRLAFSEIEEGADGWFDLISKTAEQRADIHRIGNREIVLETAFHSGWKPIGAIFQGPEQIVQSMQAAERFVARGGAKAFFRKYDKLHNLLRGYMIMKPGFHMRNFFSAVFMNHLAGMDWSNYRRFMRAYWKFQEEEAMRLGLPDKASKMRKAMRARGIDPSKVSAEHVDYVRELADSGTLGGAGAQVASEFVDTSSGAAGKATVRIGGKKVNLLAAANPASSQNALLKLSKTMGMATETFVRGALGFDTLYKGLAADEAFENVMKFHFDYDDLSDFERNVIKKVVPFYTWTRKNMPLMMEMAARRPAVFNKYNSLKKEMEYGQDRPKIVPQWMERQGAIQTPWKFEGESMFILPDLPFKAPMELLEPSLRFSKDQSVMDRLQIALGTLGTQITPLIKAPYEWKAKQNLWKDYNFSGQYEVVPRAYAKVPFLMDALALPGIAAKNSKGQWAMKDYELHAIGQLLPTLTDLRRLFPDEERYQERAVSTWISFLFGAGLRTNTKWEQDMERRSRAYEMQDEMKQERSLSGARL